MSLLRAACVAPSRTDGMLVALGAQITISELVAGRTAQRLTRACDWLDDWCARASAGGPCSPACYVHLFSSWLEARKVDGNSDWLSFLSGRAVNNRRAFVDELRVLLRAQTEGDGIECTRQRGAHRHPPRMGIL